MKRTYFIPQVTLNSIELQSSIMAASMMGRGLIIGGNTSETGNIPHGD